MIHHYTVGMIFTEKLQLQMDQINVSERSFEALIKNGRYFVFFYLMIILSLDTHIHIVYMVHFSAVFMFQMGQHRFGKLKVNV